VKGQLYDGGVLFPGSPGAPTLTAAAHSRTERRSTLYGCLKKKQSDALCSFSKK
jgi:hypothetical protein